MSGFREAFPILNADDVDAAVTFYTATFGFRESFRYADEEGRAAFAFLALEPLGIGLARRAEGEARDFALWLYADDVDVAAERSVPPAARRCCRRPTSRGASGCAPSSTRAASSSTWARAGDACVYQTQALPAPRNHAGARGTEGGLCLSVTRSCGTPPGTAGPQTDRSGS